MRKRYFSVHSDLKTGFFCKLLFIIGMLFLLFCFITYFIPTLSLSGSLPGIFLALAILFFGGSALSYFFYCQFAKLSDIATDIEQDETLIDEENDLEK